MTGLATADDIRRHIGLKLELREMPEAVAQRMLAALDDGADPDYEALWRAAWFPDPPALVYHTAPVAKRAGIQAHGLKVSQPGQGGTWENELAGMDVRWLRHQSPGVYVGAEPDIRGVWAHWPAWDVWEIQRLELPWLHDALNSSCWSLSTDVPASQVRLYATYGHEEG